MYKTIVKSILNQKVLKTISNKYKSTMSLEVATKQGTSLQSVVEELEKFAPISYAEKWDNVGLLIEPYKQRAIKKILLTNDLTKNVMEEALAKQTDMIISYHPPIFAPLKRITQSNWKERIVSACITENIALYSPHTAWDAVAGGVNDWLCSALHGTNVKPIQTNPLMPENCGAGRIFNTAVTLQQALVAIQKHIGLSVHLGLGVKHNMDTEIKTVAVCAGSGASLLKGIPADLYLTGEMSHHDVLDANHQNTSVILCNHSNSERGFLKAYQPKLSKMLNDCCEILVSEKDKDPLETYVNNEIRK